MSEYGAMVGCETAIMWIENLKGVDEHIQERVLNRVRYEFEKDIPVPVKYMKGKYGRKYDTWSCGHCGHGISETQARAGRFCGQCGYRIKEWKS